MTTDDTEPAADMRLVVWFAVKPNGCPEMGTCRQPADVPDRAVCWCRVQDKEWTRNHGKLPGVEA